ncbi:MAG: transporter substrate-binding domain-containing protein [Brachymonas sp.]|nr:transporter substrate-binding domain-containing protein [Brachymonas sp.]
MHLSHITKTAALGLVFALGACTKPAPEAPKTTAASEPASVASAPASVAAPERTIRFGSDATYPPFESTAANGEIIGFDIDLAKAMCEEMKAKCTFTNQNWDGIIPALQAKKYDVIASSMSVTPDRAKVVLFTQMIWSTPSLFVGKTGSTLDTTPAGLKGVDLGVQQGTVQDTYATKHFPDAKIKRYKSIEDAINDLGTGRLKAVFADGGVVTHLVDGSSPDKGFESVGTPVPNSADEDILGAGTAFAVRKEDTALADELNKAFDAIRANGTYKTLADKYFKFEVYNK